MPNIRPSSDLRNNYNEISAFCHLRLGKGEHRAFMSLLRQLIHRFITYGYRRTVRKSNTCSVL